MVERLAIADGLVDHLGPGWMCWTIGSTYRSLQMNSTSSRRPSTRSSYIRVYKDDYYRSWRTSSAPKKDAARFSLDPPMDGGLMSARLQENPFLIRDNRTCLRFHFAR